MDDEVPGMAWWAIGAFLAACAGFAVWAVLGMDGLPGGPQPPAPAPAAAPAPPAAAPAAWAPPPPRPAPEPALVGVRIDAETGAAEVWRDGAWRSPVGPARPSPLRRAPGRVPPAARAEAGTWTIAWEDQTSRIAIAAGPDLVQPAEVATSAADGALRVRYAARAWRAADGGLHIDARGAAVAGPEAADWSPDSFRIDADGTCLALDDRGSMSAGAVVGFTPATAAAPSVPR